MKHKFIILLCALTLNLTAQTDKEVKTLFGNGKPQIGYFLSPSLQVGKFAGSTAVIPGIGGGVIFNKKLSLNVLYKFTVTENTPVGEVDQFYLHGQWGGLKCEYSINPEKAVHLSFPLEVGIGEVELDLKDSYEGQHLIVPSVDAWFANIEPGLALEVNIWKYMKLNIAAGYRFVSDVTFRNISEKDLMGATFSAALKFGLF
jgi:hypothetical protein